MFLSDNINIKEVLLFPAMKPQDVLKNPNIFNVVDQEKISEEKVEVEIIKEQKEK